MGFMRDNNQFSNERALEAGVFARIKQQFSDGKDPFFVGNLLAYAAQEAPNQNALECGDAFLTYKQLFEYSVAYSKILAQKGVVARDRVLLYCENSIEFYVAYYAIWHLRAVVIPINIFLHEREISHIILDAQPRIIIAQELFKLKCEGLITQGFITTLPELCDIPNLQLDYKLTEHFLAQEPLLPDEMCLLLYTSGTSGVPKGVMLSSRNIMTNAMQSYARFKILSNLKQERFFCVLPLFHVFAQNACIWLPVMTLSTVIVVQKIDRKLIMQGLAKKPSIFLGFPALYGLLCLMKNAPLDSVKVFVSGADMLSDKIRLAFALIYGRRICSGYGLTEASPVVAINHYNQEYATDVVGPLVMGLTCKIRDDEGCDVEPGVIGTLWIKGDNVMLGYYKSPEMTAQVIKDGWLCTGDLASFDTNGILAIRGRSKDLIIHKGFNIYPQEIENVLMKHPNVFKAAVIGKEEDASGQYPVAFVAVRNSDDGMVESLRKLCTNHLASYKIPRKFICLEDLPMSATGKIDKKVLNTYK